MNNRSSNKGDAIAVSVEDLSIGFIRNCSSKNILIFFSDDDYDIYDKESLIEMYEKGIEFR